MKLYSAGKILPLKDKLNWLEQALVFTREIHKERYEEFLEFLKKFQNKKNWYEEKTQS